MHLCTFHFFNAPPCTSWIDTYLLASECPVCIFCAKKVIYVAIFPDSNFYCCREIDFFFSKLNTKKSVSVSVFNSRLERLQCGSPVAVTARPMQLAAVDTALF